MKRFLVLLLLVPAFVFAEQLYSPTWGFFLDLPEGYEYVEGDGKDRFSFRGPGEAMVDFLVYNGVYASPEELVNDINRRIGNRGDVDYFLYHGRQAAIMELEFADKTGWGLCVELSASGSRQPLLLALAYGPSNIDNIDLLHISALDSICPSLMERYYPGPIMEYSYSRGEIVYAAAAGGTGAMIRENDAEISQILIEREFQLLQLYVNTPYWQDAWIRYYRFIYRDSWDRVTNAVSILVQKLGGSRIAGDEAKRDFAQNALDYIQGYKYERDFTGSDFFNLVTVVTEGRGSCDSYSVLWAIILAHADIRSGIMVSREYSHAMGLADIGGIGARFESHGTKWLVAETTDKVDIGLISQDVSDPRYWIGIIFE